MSTEDKRIKIMKEGKPYYAISKMSIPVVIGMMVMVFYNLVDTFFIGLMNDPLKLAASNLAMPVMVLSMAIASMVGTGAASYIARSLGENKLKRANKTLVISFVIIAVFAAILMTIGISLVNSIVNTLGASEGTFSYTKDYVEVLFWGAFFVMGNYALGQLLRSEGSTMISMIGMLIGTAANIILDPIMIFTLGWGVRGAAIATVAGNALGMIYYLYCYFSAKTLLSLKWSQLSWDTQIIKEIFYIGVPASLEQLLAMVAIILNNNIAAAYGDLTIAAQGVVSKVMSVGNYIYMGFAAGSQPIMGYNYGARNYKRMKQLLKASIVITCSVEFVIMCIFGIFAAPIIGIFTNDAEVIRIGVIILHALMLSLPFIGATSTSRITFQAMGKPMSAFVITLVRQGVLYIPLLLILNSVAGFKGYIYAQPITEVIMMVASVLYLLLTLKKLENNSKSDLELSA